MTPRSWGALLLLSALWGGSFLFMRVAAPVLGPLLLACLRVLIAGLALLAYALSRRQLPPPGPNWRPFLVIGTINSALPFALIAAASVYLPASLTATLNATTPLFGALVGALWLGEPLTFRKLGGLALGLLGVAALVGLGPLPLSPALFLSAGASLLAALLYGVGAAYTKRKAAGVSPLALATYSQLSASLVLLPTLALARPVQLPTPTVLASVLALALLSTALAYLLYFGLIQRAGPSNALLVTYLAPAFGVLWGTLLLAEPLTVGMVAGFGLLLTSVTLLTRGPSKRSATARPPDSLG